MRDPDAEFQNLCFPKVDKHEGYQISKKVAINKTKHTLW